MASGCLLHEANYICRLQRFNFQLLKSNDVPQQKQRSHDVFIMFISEAFSFTRVPSNPTVVAHGVNSTQVNLIWQYILDAGEAIQSVMFKRQAPGDSHSVVIASRTGNTAFTFSANEFLTKYRALLPATLELLNVGINEEFLYILTVSYIDGGIVLRQAESPVDVKVVGKH